MGIKTNENCSKCYSVGIDKNVINEWKASADIRVRRALQSNLECSRKGEGTEWRGRGHHCTAVIGMPDDMITPEDIKQANADIRKISNYIENFGDIDTFKGHGEIDFVAIRLVRVLYNAEGRLEGETKMALKRFFLKDNFASIHKSENHMIMFRAARYLAACYYSDETFSQYEMKGYELKKADHDYIVGFMRHRAKRGWAEFNSMGYECENINTLTALYDHAEDEDVRKLAKMLVDTIFLTMIENTTENSIYGGAHGRAYGSVISGLHYGIYWFSAVYFGCGDFNNTDIPLTTFGESQILLSKYRPDDTVYAAFANKKYPFAAFERVHNHTLDYAPKDYGFINKYTYNTSLYSIGCVNHQDDSHTWYDEHQQTNWSLAFASNPKAAITSHHPGNTGLHSYWHGDHNCLCNHLFGHKNVVMGIYYIPQAYDGLMNFIHANVPKAHYDEVIEVPEKNRIFIRIGDAYAALMFSHPYDWGGKKPESEIVVYDGEKTEDIRIAMACEAGSKDENGSFESFIDSVNQKDFDFNSSELYLKYGNMEYEVVPNKENPKFAEAENQYLNGLKVNSVYEYTYNSPIMKSKTDSGVIEVYCGNAVRTMDFINISDTVKWDN